MPVERSQHEGQFSVDATLSILNLLAAAVTRNVIK